MVQAVEQSKLVQYQPPSFQEAWVMVVGQLQAEMKSGLFMSWVKPLVPLGYKEGVFRVAATNIYARDWVISNLRSRITGLLEAAYNQPVTLSVGVGKDRQSSTAPGDAAAVPAANPGEEPAESPDSGMSEALLEPMDDPLATGQLGTASDPATTKVNGSGAAGQRKPPRAHAEAPRAQTQAAETGSSRKILLENAYGTKRAAIIRPHHGMFMTMYFFNNWLPLLGHSALTTIIAARSLCYWNVATGEKRDTIETDMSELARRASVSVRTVKDVLNNALVKKYFLRYRVRRMMTPNGIRTAGIVLQVRMDDPLTPEDQQGYEILESDHWYTSEFDDESED